MVLPAQQPNNPLVAAAADVARDSLAGLLAG
jgi:hypothetical protein